MRGVLELDDLTGLLAATFGVRPVTGLHRLSGGTSKGVYRLAFADGGTVLAYRWHPDENFWPARAALDVGPFAADPGRAAFLDRHALLTGLGVRVPRILALHPGADVALVEDLAGGTLEALLARDATAGRAVMARLRAMLRRMHAHTTAVLPWPGHTCPDLVAERGRRALVEAAARVPRIDRVRDRLADELAARLAAVAPRSVYGVIHGELGPDHVMVDDAGIPALIDIDGTMVFDVEWEHAFLELRFGPLYDRLRTVPLDEARMRLYRLVHHLSLVAGPLLLIEGDFPQRERMREIAAGHTERVLSSLSQA
jgi:aminoglycoside phosphotransferase